MSADQTTKHWPGDLAATWPQVRADAVPILERPCEVPCAESVDEVARWEDPDGFGRTEPRRLPDDQAPPTHHVLRTWLCDDEVQKSLDSHSSPGRTVIASQEPFGEDAAGGYFLGSVPGFGTADDFQKSGGSGARGLVDVLVKVECGQGSGSSSGCPAVPRCAGWPRCRPCAACGRPSRRRPGSSSSACSPVCAPSSAVATTARSGCTPSRAEKASRRLVVGA